MTQRNNSIDFLRFIFMIILCLWHFYLAKPHLLYHGYLVVEFFFMLSGFLMYNSLTKPSLLSPVDYLMSRLKRFLPEYWICLAICVIIHTIHFSFPPMHLYELMKWSVGILCDCLLLQSIGIFNDVSGWNNNPMWYLSVLIYAQTIIYAILYLNKKIALNFVLPSICILFYSWAFHHYHQLEVWTYDGPFYMPFCRGLAGISLGVLTAAIFNNKHISFIQTITSSPITAIVSLIIFLLTFITWNPLDEYSLLFVPLIIVSCANQMQPLNRLFNGKIWNYLGKLSWEFFLCHYLVLESIDFFIPLPSNNIILIIEYFILVLISSCLLAYINNKFIVFRSNNK